jgi:hypothetical protein
LVFTVVCYGCSSDDMWCPAVRVFSNYAAAYDSFLQVAPPLDSENRRTIHYRNPNYNPDYISNDYILIEDRRNTNVAQCMSGAAIARIGM